MIRALAAAALFVSLVGETAAQPACPADAADRAAALRKRLDHERERVYRWRLGWGVGFGVAAMGQGGLVLAETSPLGTYDEAAEASLMAGTVKSIIGLGARVISPIKIRHPKVTGDACADLASAEDAFALAAKTEKASFWLNHIGGLSLQIGATLYIGMSADNAWDDAAISFVLGYAIGTFSTYTQPRSAWHEHRRPASERTWEITPMASPQAQGLSVVGTF